MPEQNPNSNNEFPINFHRKQISLGVWCLQNHRRGRTTPHIFSIGTIKPLKHCHFLQKLFMAELQKMLFIKIQYL